jgi:hypothetical protein
VVRLGFGSSSTGTGLQGKKEPTEAFVLDQLVQWKTAIFWTFSFANASLCRTEDTKLLV